MCLYIYRYQYISRPNNSQKTFVAGRDKNSRSSQQMSWGCKETEQSFIMTRCAPPPSLSGMDGSVGPLWGPQVSEDSLCIPQPTWDGWQC